MGETSIDEDTFNDYVQEMNSIYTADKVRDICVVLNSIEPLLTGAYSTIFLVRIFYCVVVYL